MVTTPWGAAMHALYVESQPSAVGTDIAVRLTRHLCVRQLSLQDHPQSTGWRGPVAVVAQDPLRLLKQTQKQWSRLRHHAQHACSDTNDTRYLVAFTNLIAMMQSVYFTTNIMPEDERQYNVTFATAGDYSTEPPFCRIMYVTYAVPAEQLHQITAWMPRHAIVVIF
jgi:hypothetical protein